MGIRVLQNSFLGGEISPEMLGRVDDAAYGAGATKIENFLVLPQGTLKKRSGFRYVASSVEDSPIRLMPFRFSSDQTLVLVFSHRKLQIVTEGKILLSGGSPYAISTPYNAEDLFELDFSQNADIITITSYKYPPTELRRYGATDWRFYNVTTSPTISAPYSLSATAVYPAETEAKEKDKIEATYVVTAIDENNQESVPSSSYTIKCNYFLTGGAVNLSWGSVSGAKRYRIYRSVVGIYGFLGETENTSTTDVGNEPDTTHTPPRYSRLFDAVQGAVSEVKVIDGGKGYFGSASASITLPQYIDLPYVRTNSWTSEPQAEEVTTPATYTLEIYSSSSLVGTVNIPTGVGGTKITGNVGKRVSSVDTTALVDFSNGAVRVNLGGYSGRSYSYLKFKVTCNKGTFSRGGEFKNGSAVRDYEYNLTHAFESKYDKLYTSGVTLAELCEIYEQPFDTPISLTVVDSNGGSGASVQATVRNGSFKSVQVINGGSGYRNPTIRVNSETGFGAVFQVSIASSSKVDYPSAVTQYDQRRVFAGTRDNPLKIWLTNAAQQNLMMYHIPTRSDDRIEITAVTSDADRIKHAVALESLILFTGSSELRVYTQNSDALSPDSIAVRAQSYVGANSVQPVIVNSNVVYIASRGGHVRHLAYAYSNSGYATDDISLRATHLFDGFDIVDMTLSKAPVQTIWCVSTSGLLLSATYVPEQNIVAWSEHSTVNGEFESVCAVSEGNEDHLYVVVKRYINGRYIRMIERMANLDFVDNYYSRHLDSYLDAVFERAQSSISGLSHLEGETVGVFVDGKPQGNKVVSNGMIYLTTPGRNIAVGLPFSSTLVTNPLVIQSASDLQGMVKNVGEVALRVSRDGDIWSGVYPQTRHDFMYKCDRDNVEFKFQNPDSQVVKLSIDGTWDLQGQLQIESRDCLPLEISAIIGNVNIEQSKGK